MKKFIPAFVFVLLFALTNLSQTITPTPTPKPSDGEDVVKISTTLVQVDATVTDNKGKVVRDLKPEDFEIYENGKKQEITNFSFISAGSKSNETVAKSDKNNKLAVPVPPAQLEPAQVRRTIALVVDDLTLSFESTHFVRRALRNFVEDQMQNGDLVAIIRTGAGIGALQQFTSDKRQLLAAIEKVQWNPRGAGGISAFDPLTPGDLETIQENKKGGDIHKEADLDTFRSSVFATGTLGAINYVVNGMKELPGRKSIMLLSDGFQLFEKNGGGLVDSSRVLRSLENLIDAANRASVVIYTMDARGLQTTGITAADDVGSRTVGGKVITTDKIEAGVSDRRTKFFDSQDGLVALARETGGFPILNDNDLSGGIRRVLDDQSYYLIGYEPDADTFDPKTRRFNKIEIKVNRKNTDVRYRSGFLGVTDEQFKKPVNQTAEQQILTALVSPFAVNDISLHLNTLFGNNDKQGLFVRSLLYVDAKDLKFSEEADGTKKAVFDVLAMNFGDNGVVADQISQTYTVNLKKDDYQKSIDEGFVYYFTFVVKKPGAYQMRVAIRDHATEKVGSASQFIEVPNLKKNRLTLSGVVLENLSLAQWNAQAQTNQSKIVVDKNEKQPDSMTDTALRTYKRGTVLRYGFEIYNAKSAAQNLQIQTRIFHDGKAIFESKPKPPDALGQTNSQNINATGAMSLGTEMPPGDYIMQIIITDPAAKEKNNTAAQFVQFEIVP